MSLNIFYLVCVPVIVCEHITARVNCCVPVSLFSATDSPRNDRKSTLHSCLTSREPNGDLHFGFVVLCIVRQTQFVCGRSVSCQIQRQARRTLKARRDGKSSRELHPSQMFSSLVQHDPTCETLLRTRTIQCVSWPCNWPASSLVLLAVYFHNER